MIKTEKTVIIKPLVHASQSDVEVFLHFLFDVLVKDTQKQVAQSNADVVESAA